MKTQSPLIFILIVISIVTVLHDNAFAENNFLFSKTLDVEKQTLQDTLIDVKNYERVFPTFVKSANILEESDNITTTELNLDFGIIPMSVQVEHNTLGKNTHEIKVISGDLKGSKVITSLEKTWGYDGSPDMGTIVHMDLSLEVSGFLSLFGIVNENLIHYSVDHSLLRLVDYAQGGDFTQENLHKASYTKKRAR